MEGEKKTWVTDECVVCMNTPPTHVFSPCHHCCCCSDCADSVVAAKMPCPLCRQAIVSKHNRLLPEATERVPLVEVASFRLDRRNDYLYHLPSRIIGRAMNAATPEDTVHVLMGHMRL